MIAAREIAAPRLDGVAVAYKEWAGVCRALGEGRQTILLRKGGVSEEEGVFRPEYPAFWLYPTHVHEAEQGLRIDRPVDDSPASVGVSLECLAVVESVTWLDQLAEVERLADFHVWTAETVRKRFEYRRPGLWVLGVRVYRRDRPWPVPPDPQHAGCKTWVPLESAPEPAPLASVLSDGDAVARRADLFRILDPPDAPRKPRP